MTLIKRILLRVWGIAACLLIWQIWTVESGVNALLVPSPTRILADILDRPSFFLQHSASTLGLCLASYLTAAAIATALGIASHLFRPARIGINLTILAITCVPIVIFIPQIILTFGYGIEAQLIISVLGILIPFLSFINAGLAKPSEGASDLSKVLGTRQYEKLIYIDLPNMIPMLVSACARLAPVAMLMTLLSEFLIGVHGLGYVARSAAALYDTPGAFAAAVLATSLTLCLRNTLNYLEYITLNRFS